MPFSFSMMVPGRSSWLPEAFPQSRNVHAEKSDEPITSCNHQALYLLVLLYFLHVRIVQIFLNPFFSIYQFVNVTMYQLYASTMLCMKEDCYTDILLYCCIINAHHLNHLSGRFLPWNWKILRPQNLLFYLYLQSRIL